MEIRQLSLEGDFSIPPNMDRLAIIRRGDYLLDNGRLSALGRTQIHKLGQMLESLVNEERVLVLSSTAPRALDSAKIIADILEVPVEEHEVLWADDDHRSNFDAVHQLVQSIRRKTNFGVLVTHLEYAQFFPSFLAKRDFGVSLPRFAVKKGEAVILDYRSKNLTYLSR